jgi:hypothetical protein
MEHQRPAFLPSEYRRWWGYALILLMPGSFVVLTAIALIRALISRHFNERSRTCVPLA